MEESKESVQEAPNANPVQPPTANQSQPIAQVIPKKSKVWVWIIVIVAVIVLYNVVNLFLPMTSLIAIPLKPVTEKYGMMTTSPAVDKSKIDQQVVGNWDTGCLVPDLDSAWAERHQFEIKSDGTATHWRSSGASCLAIAKEEPQNYRLEIVGTGKVNFIDQASGLPAIFDIYEVASGTLYFGHGFNNGMSTSSKSGGSDGDRFNGLNKFLAYKKVN